VTSVAVPPGPDDQHRALGEGAVRLRRGLETLIGIPATEGNLVHVLRNGCEAFPAMLAAIRQAEETIDLLTFQLGTGDIVGEIVDALVERANAGVRVRMVLDTVGSRNLSAERRAKLEDSGISVVWFRKPSQLQFWNAENRTHRKVLVVDQRLGFAGGINMSEEWTGDARTPDEWRDTHLRIEGPAVDGLTAGFVTDWVAGGLPAVDLDATFRSPEQPGTSLVQVVRGEPSTGWSDIANALAALLRLARHRVRIASAYFAPDDYFTKLLCEAGDRGVDVEVMVPGENAHSRFVQLAAEAQFERLMGAGVRIWSYEPTMIHAKIVLVDDLVACVGSANFDRRSMKLNHEIEVMVLDPEVVAVLDGHYDDDLERCIQVEPGWWRHRDLQQRALEHLVRPFRGRL
jgi:cardiolipin synthase A/B